MKKGYMGNMSKPSLFAYLSFTFCLPACLPAMVIS